MIWQINIVHIMLLLLDPKKMKMTVDGDGDFYGLVKFSGEDGLTAGICDLLFATNEAKVTCKGLSLP